MLCQRPAPHLQGDFVPASLIFYFSQLNEILNISPEKVYRGTQYWPVSHTSSGEIVVDIKQVL